MWRFNGKGSEELPKNYKSSVRRRLRPLVNNYKITKQSDDEGVRDRVSAPRARASASAHDVRADARRGGPAGEWSLACGGRRASSAPAATTECERTVEVAGPSVAATATRSSRIGRPGWAARTRRSGGGGALSRPPGALRSRRSQRWRRRVHADTDGGRERQLLDFSAEEANVGSRDGGDLRRLGPEVVMCMGEGVGLPECRVRVAARAARAHRGRAERVEL